MLIADHGELIHIRRIPKLTTGKIQPMDVYGFRPYKNFIRTISDLPEISKNNFGLRIRNNVIKLQSIVFNQMCSPRYQPMFQYGWYKAGYVEERPVRFETPVDFCFRAVLLRNCEAENCDSSSFMRCSWCKKKQQLCFQDFILNYHLCYDYDE